ncbi:recombinase family protein [Nonomuraea wenchangensis]
MAESVGTPSARRREWLLKDVLKNLGVQQGRQHPFLYAFGSGALIGYGRVSTRGRPSARSCGRRWTTCAPATPSRSPLREALDTTTPGGRLVFHVFAAPAEFIRELVVEGTREGPAAARGQRLGRPRAITAEQIRHARAVSRRPTSKQTADHPSSERVWRFVAGWSTASRAAASSAGLRW